MEEEAAENIGRAFVEFYYNLFDNHRASLFSLYQASSILSFEGQRIEGGAEICAKLNQLPFDECRHTISTIDSQPSPATGGFIVFASGSLRLPGEDHPLRFSQMFHLLPASEGRLFVQNEIFRLNYG
ncbi:nuclear transport factor 2B-like [Diospyros lotus]|uniref:nuclear transport factor 2B-like n=1 Tax=Diospyros lotus TaxID=55363 RepID=UPI0022502D1A|nr:nuclear transport factor 2B-like [Diospyros lotus]